jgi:DNA-binding NtrC family response regulator
MDGRIWFVTEPGNGTTFVIEFPEWTAEEPTPEPAEPGPHEVHSGQARILHVEDDVDLRRTVAEIGQSVGRFVPAGTLAEARQRLEEDRVDLVLLDPELPDGSAWDLIPTIQAIEPAPPVVVFSASQVTPEEASLVKAAFLKSRTAEAELVDTLARLLAVRNH